MLAKKGSMGVYMINGIYRHYKGSFYRIKDVGKLHDSQNIYLIVYEQVTKDGIYVSIRPNPKNPDEIVFQPFITHETRWEDELIIDNVKIKRFKLKNIDMKVIDEGSKYELYNKQNNNSFQVLQFLKKEEIEGREVITDGTTIAEVFAMLEDKFTTMNEKSPSSKVQAVLAKLDEIKQIMKS